MSKIKNFYPWDAILKKTRKIKKKELKTGIVVERQLIGGIESIYVVDPEIVEAPKKGLFFISEKPVKKRFKLF